MSDSDLYSTNIIQWANWLPYMHRYTVPCFCVTDLRWNTFYLKIPIHPIPHIFQLYCRYGGGSHIKFTVHKFQKNFVHFFVDLVSLSFAIWNHMRNERSDKNEWIEINNEIFKIITFLFFVDCNGTLWRKFWKFCNAKIDFFMNPPRRVCHRSTTLAQPS